MQGPQVKSSTFQEALLQFGTLCMPVLYNAVNRVITNWSFWPSDASIRQDGIPYHEKWIVCYVVVYSWKETGLYLY